MIEESPRSDARPIALAILIFATLSISAAILSDGFLEADACTHYLYARFAFDQPHFFVNIWGRPICTGIYSVPALLAGRIGVRMMSLLLAIGCGLVAHRIARNQGYRHPVLALIFTLAQPLVFLHSFSELTELPFALMIGLAFLAYQKNRWLAMTLIIGFTPLSRPEGFGFIPLAATALILHRQWKWLPILPIPLILWSLAGWLMYGREGQWWMWLVNNWPYAKDSLYEPGNILHFILCMPAIVSPFVFPFVSLGIWKSLDHIRKESINDALIAVIPLLILIGHSVLFALGKMASNGELRYMLVVAPFWALLGARGWEWFFGRFDIRFPLRWAAIAVLLPILANVYWKVVPIPLDQDSLRARRAVVWYQTSGISTQFPRLGTAHPIVYYFLDMPLNDPTRSLDWRRDVLKKTVPGTILIWDSIYGVFNSDANRSVKFEELLEAGWLDATDRVPTLGENWRVLLSPTDAHGQAVNVQALPDSP